MTKRETSHNQDGSFFKQIDGPIGFDRAMITKDAIVVVINTNDPVEARSRLSGLVDDVVSVLEETLPPEQ